MQSVIRDFHFKFKSCCPRFIGYAMELSH